MSKKRQVAIKACKKYDKKVQSDENAKKGFVAKVRFCETSCWPIL